MKYSLKRGYSPIHLAAYYGQVSVIEYLVRNQTVNVNLKDKGIKGIGLTPLFSAVNGCFKRRDSQTFKETIDKLIELKADPTVTIEFDKNQKTAQPRRRTRPRG